MTAAKPLSRFFSGNRVIWLLAAVAVVFLTAGIVIARFIESPADAAAKVAPPEAGLITVPVENRVIANDVSLRADVLYDESVAVSIDTTDISGTPVVTGQVPEVGTTVDAASVVLEVAGRPVIALPGELPAYRTLRVGVSGPDVVQLKQALAALGINPGNVESDVYDAATVAAVDQLYVTAGYPSPAASDEDTAALQSARDGLRSAKDMLAEAETALTTAAGGAPQSVRMEAQRVVNDAQRALNQAVATRDTPQPAAEGEAPVSPQSLQDAVDSAQEALDIAIAARDEANAGTGTSSEVTARDNARSAVEQAQADLDTALESTMTALPAAEVVYFSNLPRRVDQVQTKRGTTLSGSTPFMSVSGANVVVEGSLAASDAELLEVGMPGTFPIPDGGGTVTGTVSEITAATAADDTEGDSEGDGDGGDAAKSSRVTVTFVPEGLTEEQIAVLLGQNIKITVPVSSTGEEVLAVPAAALTAGSGGESRIERAASDGTTALVTVETGLAADGFVQIVSSEQPLSASDQVVVGK